MSNLPSGVNVGNAVSAVHARLVPNFSYCPDSIEWYDRRYMEDNEQVGQDLLENVYRPPSRSNAGDPCPPIRPLAHRIPPPIARATGNNENEANSRTSN